MVEVRLEEGEKEPPGTECRQFLKDKEDKEVDYTAKPLTVSTQANTLTLARRVCFWTSDSQQWRTTLHF